MKQDADHPDEEKVLLLLDNELDSFEAETIGNHLQQCKECQAKMQRLRQGIQAFVVYRQAYFLPSVGAPPKGWTGFPALLDRISTTGEGPGSKRELD